VTTQTDTDEAPMPTNTPNVVLRSEESGVSSAPSSTVVRVAPSTHSPSSATT